MSQLHRCARFIHSQFGVNCSRLLQINFMRHYIILPIYIKLFAREFSNIRLFGFFRIHHGAPYHHTPIGHRETGLMDMLRAYLPPRRLLDTLARHENFSREKLEIFAPRRSNNIIFPLSNNNI
jgi:hypothetical protein